MKSLIGKIHNESCLDTLKKTDDNSVDTVITSPPYDDLRTRIMGSLYYVWTI